jgi:hypothetical protein
MGEILNKAVILFPRSEERVGQRSVVGVSQPADITTNRPHRGQILVEKNTSPISRAVGTEPVRNALALMPLQVLRTDGTLLF